MDWLWYTIGTIAHILSALLILQLYVIFKNPIAGKVTLTPMGLMYFLIVIVFWAWIFFG